MGAFEDTILELWKTLGRTDPPPAGRTAEVVINDVEFRLADRGRHIRARALAGPLAADEPQRGAQIRAALHLSLGSLKRRPLVIHVKQDQNRQVIFVEQTIAYKNGSLLSLHHPMSHMSQICWAIMNRDQEANSFSGLIGNFHYDHENPMENEFVFRI